MSKGSQITYYILPPEGRAYKENVPDTRESPVKEMVKELKEFGVAVYGYDPLLSKEVILERFSFSTNFSLKKKPLLKKYTFLAQVLSFKL